MELSNRDLVLLKALYKAPDMAGEIVVLLQEKGYKISLEQAHAIGEKLHKYGYINYQGSRGFSDVTLANRGIEHVEDE